MSSTEIELLQLPVDGAHPCGEDLEYDPEFMALQQAMQGKREQQFGATIIPAEPPDWSKVDRLALQLCQRTRDLRVLVALTLARTETHGLPGYAEGLTLVHTVLQSFWDDVHPRLVDDGEEDPLPRMNALAALAESDGVGRSVRDAPLFDGDGPPMSLRQVEALLDSSRNEQIDYPGGLGRLRDVARRADENGAPPVVALRAALDLLQRIRATAEQALGQSWAPDFSRLERSIRTVVQILPGRSQSEDGAAAPADALQAPDGQAASATGAPAIAAATTAAASGAVAVAAKPAAPRIQDIEILSRDDVQVVLEKACRYLENTEPSHPAPILIRRAKKLLDLNFFQIIEELMPEGVQKIEALAGQSPSATSSD